MTDMWLSTKSPRNIFRPGYQTPELEAALREAQGIDPAIIAADVGICRGHVASAQRKLGLRKITGNVGRKK